MKLVTLYRTYPLFFKIALILLLLVCDLVLFEKNRFICEDRFGVFLIILHRLHSIIVLLTPFLFGFYRFHLLYIFIIGSSWIYNGSCIITIWHNEICKIKKKYDESGPKLLCDYLGIHPFYEPLFGIFALMIYDIYMIYHGH